MLPARLTGRAASAVLVLVSLALAAACKRDPAPDASADAAVAASASSLAPPLPPSATLDAAATRHDDERPLDPKLAPLVDAVVTDPLVSEGFLLLHDGMDTESVDQLLAKNPRSSRRSSSSTSQTPGRSSSVNFTEGAALGRGR